MYRWYTRAGYESLSGGRVPAAFYEDVGFIQVYIEMAVDVTRATEMLPSSLQLVGCATRGHP